MTQSTNFYWSLSTLNHFRFESNYQSKKETIRKIKLFVENECSLEDGETEEDLINDLVGKIFPITMSEKITAIKKAIKRTHNKQDFKDLETFNNEEINEIYNQINE